MQPLLKPQPQPKYQKKTSNKGYSIPQAFYQPIHLQKIVEMNSKARRQVAKL